MSEAWEIEFYRSERGRAPVAEFIEGLPPKMQARVLRTVGLLEEHGAELGMPFARPVTGHRFWELRVGLGRDIVRIFYFAASGRRMVLLHGFVKKTQRTPPQELAVAAERREGYLRRQ